jgi:outer membrane lipoprotein SlyB
MEILRKSMTRFITYACFLSFALPLTLAAGDSRQTLASAINVYVFPAEGQDSSQQSKDESACYEWAVENTGSDPFDLAKQNETDQQQAQADMEAAGQVQRGAGARSAVRGAAAGAVIGEIASDDAGKGAAYGAAAGAIAGRRRSRAAQQQAQAQIAAEAQQNEEITTHQTENFKKAFSACLEGKHYTVKH